ncbi:hypothetical protein AYI69_g6299 [Smittium culicis]|uniref:XRRM domain-containing protein n=1 Tax=Smittium culicis TaxID=133412 RepID=A0A1R1XZY1_9FUNG|nr:hypothetical protein AYI69_g6299 [Smittium culicis]
MYKDSLRPSGIKTGSIVRVHGISPNSTHKVICQMFSFFQNADYIDYKEGSISAYLAFNSIESAENLVEHFASKKLYHLNGNESELVDCLENKPKY